MPTTFDFKNTALSPRTYSASSSTSMSGTVTNTDGGVTFTMSGSYYNFAYSNNYLNFGFANNSSQPGIFFSVSSAFSGLTSASFTLFVSSAGNTQFSGLSSLRIDTAFGADWSVAFLGPSLTPVGSASVTGPQTLTATGQIAAIRFSISNFSTGYIGISSMTVGTMNCFCAGTLIETPDGPRAIEDLQQGDSILTADGRVVPVNWLGVQEVDTRLRHPKMVNPICIRAGAFGDGLPTEDLYVSKDHAINIDGTLYNAGALVNGSTIFQVAEMPLDGFEYYHVDIGAHDLLLANGVAAESYIDYAGTEGFANGDAREATVEMAEMDLPRVSSPRQVPPKLRTRLVSHAVPTQGAA